MLGRVAWNRVVMLVVMCVVVGVSFGCKRDGAASVGPVSERTPHSQSRKTLDYVHDVARAAESGSAALDEAVSEEDASEEDD